MKKYSDLKLANKPFDIDVWDRDDVPTGELSGDEVLPQIKDRLERLVSIIDARITGDPGTSEYFSAPPRIWDLNDIYKEMKDILRHFKEGK